MENHRQAAVLVTGGAGYIGSHVVRELLERGHPVVVLDNLSKGHAAAVGTAPLIRGNYGDETALSEAFSALGSRSIDFVIHLAASSEVGESVRDPSHYYRNNLSPAPALLDAAVRAGVRGIVLSSTAAVYGEPDSVPIDETHPVAPTNPYGETKRALETMLSAYRTATALPWIALRYFNAAGAHPTAEIGEDHNPESHLIPLLVQAALGGKSQVTVFGRDYPTRDGTCVRDYVHVCDLAVAHVAAMDALDRGIQGPINLGTGVGTTVLEILAAVERVSGRSLQPIDRGRRPGDPACLVASADLARTSLGWTPTRSDIDTIVSSAWKWHRRHPNGYDATSASPRFENKLDIR